MSSHYIPYGEHYEIKKLVHKSKSQSINNITPTDQHKKSKSVLIIVDVQKDFLPGGTLPIMAHKSDKGYRDCELMINSINEMIIANVFDYYVFSQDAHLPGHVSFASSHKDKNPFNVVTLSNGNKQILWPNHCVISETSDGISLSDKLVLPVETESWRELIPIMTEQKASSIQNNHIVACRDIQPINYPGTDINDSDDNIHHNNDNTLMSELLKKSYIIWKGLDKNVDSYSAFKDAEQNETGLRRFCNDRGIKDVYICGIARDFCCWWTAVDATTYEYGDLNGLNKKEFNVHFVLDATLPVPGSINLPDYDTKGKTPHQLMIKKLTPEIVHGDLQKNHTEGNMWIKTFLEPYGIHAMSWSEVINSLKKENNDNIKNINQQLDGHKGGSIFVKNKKKLEQKPSSTIDYDFLMNIAKLN
jgi:nicotinamidase-related amidase